MCGFAHDLCNFLELYCNSSFIKEMTQEESTEFERQIFNREKESPFFWIGPYALALKSDMIALKLKLVLLECKIQFPLEKSPFF